MVTKRQETGDIGEKFVIKHVRCPICNKGKFIKMSIKNFPCADIICKFCGILGQVKSFRINNLNKIPKKIGGSAWPPFNKRIRKGIFYPLFIVLIEDNKPKKILYISKDIQKVTYQINKKLYISRIPLGNHCRRAGWQGFDYNLELIPSFYIQTIK